MELLLKLQKVYQMNRLKQQSRTKLMPRKRNYVNVVILLKKTISIKTVGKIITTSLHSLRRLQELQVSEWLQQFNHALAEIVEV